MFKKKNADEINCTLLVMQQVSDCGLALHHIATPASKARSYKDRVLLD